MRQVKASRVCEVDYFFIETTIGDPVDITYP